MIPTIIYLLIRHYKKVNPANAERLAIIFRKASRIALLFILFILIGCFAWSQSSQSEYIIKRKGQKIGIISFSQHHSGYKKVFRMESKIKTRFLFLFTATGQEESVYENGIMTFSSIYQRLNGNERMNKKTRLMGKNYVITKGEKTETMSSYPIFFNMICLYASEPVNISKIYSDSFQQFLDIQSIRDHHYKISFPDGNYNEYYYTNGVCTKVEVHHKFYRSSFELKK
jgi:hypothetical protein